MRTTKALWVLGTAAMVAGCGPVPEPDSPHDAVDADRAARASVQPAEPVVIVVQCPAMTSCPAQVAAPPPAVTVVPPAVAVAPPPYHDPYVRWEIARHAEKFQKCYEKGLRRNPGLSGTVVVRLRVDEDGDVDKAFDWGSTLPDRRVVDCVVSAYERIHFKRYVGPTLIDRIEFRPT